MIESRASYRFRVMSDGTMHHVFVVHDKTPHWFRLVASFPSKERAEGYADVENDCADDKSEYWEPAEDEKPAPVKQLPPTPRTAVDSCLVDAILKSVEPTPAEKARVGAGLITDAAQEAGHGPVQIEVKPQPEAKPQTRAEYAPGKFEVPKKLGKTGQTNKESLLPAIQKFVAHEGRFPSYQEMAAESGIPLGSCPQALYSLVDDGHIIRLDAGKYKLAEPVPAAKGGKP